MIAAADPVMPGPAEAAPMRTAGGFFNRGEVLRLPGERRGAAFHLCAGAPHERAPHRERGGACERNRQSSHSVLLEAFHLTQPRRRPSRQSTRGCCASPICDGRRRSGNPAKVSVDQRFVLEATGQGEGGSASLAFGGELVLYSEDAGCGPLARGRNYWERDDGAEIDGGRAHRISERLHDRRGTLHEAVKPVMEKTNMLENTVETVKRARELGATIVHAPITFTDEYYELSPTPYGILKGVVDSKSFLKDGARTSSMFRTPAGDIVIEGKRGLDGFASTNLDFILRGRGYRRLRSAVFSPLLSSNVYWIRKGYDVITLNDCTATVSEEEQKFAVEKLPDVFAPDDARRVPCRASRAARRSRQSRRGYEAA